MRASVLAGLVGVVAAFAACSSSDYCGAYQSTVSTLDAKFRPCADAGFAPNFVPGTCENVLNGGNCTDGDRTELQKLGAVAIGCAEANPTCSPQTPLNQLGLALQFQNCVADAGIPASAVSVACIGALATVSAAP